MNASEQKVIDDFHKLFYGTYKIAPDGASRHYSMSGCRWLGTVIMKNPFDLLIYQEILWDTRPDLIVECGTSEGGSALFFAGICELMRHGNVFTIDQHQYLRPLHPGIIWACGDVFDPKILAAVQEMQDHGRRIMVVLDDDHHKGHVLKEMETYGKFVSQGCYMVVEDSNANGHPVFPEFGPGPYEAIQEFLPKHPEFKVDKQREHFRMTYNPSGWLLKS